MTDEPEDDRPWNEDQRERFMRESEVRSARFGELLETLIDHPDRDEIIRREMGWNQEGDEAEADDEPDWEADAIEAINESPSEEELNEFRRQREEFETNPAYRRSFDWSIRVHDALKEEFGQLGGDLEERLAEALADAGLVPAKLAAGHGMGYEDDSLCGNIVCCKWSLEAANRCLGSLSELSDGHPPLRPRLAPLSEEGREVERLVAARIAELRTRVWWV